MRDIIKIVGQVTDKEVSVIEGSRRPGGADAAIVYADPAKAERILGWKAHRTVEDMIASAWAWRLSHPNGYEE